jgi:UDP-glucose 4-epimerase
VRDYIHVCDLAEGHVAALRYLFERDEGLTVNLGTGRGHSVLEVVRAYAKPAAARFPMPWCHAGPAMSRPALPTRRAPTGCWAGAPTRPERMCADSWRWQQHEPAWLRRRPVPERHRAADSLHTLCKRRQT